MAGAPTATASGPDRERLRMSLRILLHIDRQARLGPGDLPARAPSPAGMVEAPALNQGALAGALQRLIRSGVVPVERSHVRGIDRRVKVYRLTAEGEAFVRDLRTRVVEPTRSAGRPSRLSAPGA